MYKTLYKSLGFPNSIETNVPLEKNYTGKEACSLSLGIGIVVSDSLMVPSVTEVVVAVVEVLVGEGEVLAVVDEVSGVEAVEVEGATEVLVVVEVVEDIVEVVSRLRRCK